MSGHTIGLAPNPSYTIEEFVAYLHRVGYHDIAERVSADRQIIVIRPDSRAIR